MVPSSSRFFRTLVAFAIPFLWTCGGGGGDGNSGTNPPTGPAPVASVVVTPASATINVGGQTQLSATARDASGNTLTGKTFTWSSDATGTATVSASGLVTGLADGPATITATSDGVSGTSSITVVDPPVSSVTVSPDPADVAVGQTVQLTATARDAQGGELSGKTFTWASDDESTATVDASGLVSGLVAGSADITATSEGVSGTGTVNVLAPSPVMIASVGPDPMVEGESATITGTGFSATNADNAVTIDGLPATVTAASSTSLTVTVPTGVCRPKRSAPVQVAVGGQTSNSVAGTVEPSSFVDMAVGDHMLVAPGSDLCLQFDAASGTEEYLLGITSVSDVISTLSPFTVSAEASNLAPAPAVSLGASPDPVTTTGGTPLRSGDLDRHALRWSRHAASETALMEQDFRALGTPLRSGRSRVAVPGLQPAPAIPGNVTVGEQFTFKFADRSAGKNPLNDFIEITVEVVFVSDKAIFLQDIDNPAQIPSSDYPGFGDDFDDIIFDEVVNNFGAVSDVDSNGKVLVLHTKEVNDLDSPPLAFVSSLDLFPDSSVASSNVAEVYYARSPDPSGTLNAGAYSIDDARNDFRVLLAHEFTHVIQLGLRIFTNAPVFPESWVLESGATAAQEIVGFVFEGRSDGQNYNRTAVNPNAGADPAKYYSFLPDLGIYFGRMANNPNQTPQQCSWVNASSANELPGPCWGDFKSRLVYGVPWTLIQYWIQRKGLSKTAVHREITASHELGFAILESVFGESMSTLLGDWAPMLYLDDRSGINMTTFSRWQFTNWNVTDVLASWYGNDANAQLRPQNVNFSGFSSNVSVRAGSTAYFLVTGTNRTAAAIKALQGGSLATNIHQLFLVRTK